ncbi:hypothetical protein ACIBO2_56960 [Nonomuraea sp. NPDC050022]|uniref:hypothetical protein n=1 Tax=Nonomuraea sp. NPDC050022 TaxID=3364358 RepID=UPI0037AE1E83
MRLLTDFVPENTVLLAVRGGPAYAPRWQPKESGPAMRVRRQVRILQALQVIQAHSYQRIVIPEPSRTSDEELRQLVHLARLLRGPQIEATWTYADFPIPPTPAHRPPRANSRSPSCTSCTRSRADARSP